MWKSWGLASIDIALENAEMKLLNENNINMPTDSPKCLLNLPPKGWKPESRILPRPGLFARGYLYFRSGMCCRIWLTWALTMVCPFCLAIQRVLVETKFRPQFCRPSSDSESNAATGILSSHDNDNGMSSRDDLAARQNMTDYIIVNVRPRKFVYDDSTGLYSYPRHAYCSSGLHLLAATAEFRPFPPLPAQSIILTYICPPL